MILFSMPMLSFLKRSTERASTFSFLSSFLACMRRTQVCSRTSAATVRLYRLLASQPLVHFWMINAFCSNINYKKDGQYCINKSYCFTTEIQNFHNDSSDTVHVMPDFLLKPWFCDLNLNHHTLLRRREFWVFKLKNVNKCATLQYMQYTHLCSMCSPNSQV